MSRPIRNAEAIHLRRVLERREQRIAGATSGVMLKV